jgi:hypothetical protein
MFVRQPAKSGKTKEVINTDELKQMARAPNICKGTYYNDLAVLDKTKAQIMAMRVLEVKERESFLSELYEREVLNK